MDWNRALLEQFIEMYKQRPCLWNQDCKEYVNRNLKNRAYEEMVAFLQAKGMTNATTKIVKEKIQNLKRAVRKERQKIRESKRLAGSTGDVYVPSLWYYNLFTFVNPVEPTDPIDNLASPENGENNDDNSSDHIMEHLPNNIKEENHYFENEFSEASDCENHNQVIFKAPQTSILSRRDKKRKLEDNIEHFIQTFTNVLNNTNGKPDEFEALGINYAAKLRRMRPDQQIFAELLIQKVITQGLLGQLNENVDVVMNNFNQ